MSSEQKHPLGHIDREIIKNILIEGKNEHNLAEVARLRIRYHNFPGARDIQHDLDVILEQWEVTEEELFAQARQIHAEEKVYRKRKDSEDREDWS